jgi:CRISPR type III-A-associated RAMP protein Csm5
MEAGTLRGGEMDAHYDLLRFVQVSDSEPVAHEQVSVRKVRSEGTNRNTNTWLEALREGAGTRVRLSFQPEAPLRLLGLEGELAQYLRPQELFAVLAERAERRLERELAYPYPPAVKQKVQDLLAQNSEETPLLCIGWGQGYLGTTVMGLVLDESAEEYAQAVRRLLPILPRRGQGIDARRFPKTRRAVRDTKDTARSPLGWVRLVLEEASAG